MVCVWQVGFLHYPAILQITLISVKASISLSKVDLFYALWNETLLQSFNKFCTSKQCLYFITNKLAAFLAFYFKFCYWHFISHKTKQAFYIESVL